jgi:hypothetical protein
MFEWWISSAEDWHDWLGPGGGNHCIRVVTYESGRIATVAGWPEECPIRWIQLRIHESICAFWWPPRTPWIIVFVQTVPKRYIYDEKDIQPLTNYVHDLRPFDVHHWSWYSKRSIQMPEALRLLLVSGMGAALNHLVWTYLCRTRIHQFTPINDFVFCW